EQSREQRELDLGHEDPWRHPLRAPSRCGAGADRPTFVPYAKSRALENFLPCRLGPGPQAILAGTYAPISAAPERNEARAPSDVESPRNWPRGAPALHLGPTRSRS